MSDPYLSEIQIFGFNFAPRGWMQCNGQLLPINQNQALFSLLGTTFGGDGRTNFALPDLRGRVPMHSGTGIVPGLPNISLGEKSGSENHALSLLELPSHSHSVRSSSNVVNEPAPGNHTWAKDAAAPAYSSTGGSNMHNNAIGNAGSGQPHENMAPYLVLNICIALQGIFPSRN